MNKFSETDTESFSTPEEGIEKLLAMAAETFSAEELEKIKKAVEAVQGG